MPETRNSSDDPHGRVRFMPPITALDIILVSIMILSGLLAMLRGLTREMLSIMSWALSALVTLLAFINFRSMAESWVEPKMLADGLLILVVFITSLILFSLLTANVSERVLDSRVGAVDRTLGFVYGLLRGLILVAIAYMIVAMITLHDKENEKEPGKLPAWVTQARSLPLIQYTGSFIRTCCLPDDPESWLNKHEKQASPAG